ncbi:MAG: hypothetical protein IT288_15780 [Bdellovibrionales bacterium]|nr:hypothetical protein [Bdellovibrionales bacterium]
MQANWKLALVVSAVALGGLFELMKSSRFGEQPAGLSPQELRTLDYQPYARKSGSEPAPDHEGQATVKRFEALRGRSLQARPHTRGGGPQEHSFAKVPTSGTKTAKATPNKKNAKQKPKNVKTVKAKRPEAQPPEVAKPTDTAEGDGSNKDGSDSIFDNRSSPTPTFPGVAGRNGQDKNEPPSAEEWLRRVLARPSLEETTELIRQFQSNLITAEVFYHVVEQMLQDPQERMRELGIVAANSTPSYRSFTMIAQFLTDEPYGSPVRSKASQALDRYTNLAFLNVLEAVMRSQEDPGVREKALSLLVDSARKNLAKTTPPTPPPTPGGQAVQPNPLVRRYSDILKTLEEMLGNTKESPQVSTALQNAVEGLKNLLSA